MKRSYGKLIIFLLVGLLAGSLAAHLLSSVSVLAFLTKAMEVSWRPAADLDFLKYELYFQVKISLLSLAGMAAGYWLYRKT